MLVTIRGQRVKVICLLLLYSGLVLSRLPVDLKKENLFFCLLCQIDQVAS